VGKFTITNPPPSQGGVLGYIINGSKVVFISIDPDPSSPELYVGQK
jgi:hypothetical protein